MKTQSSSPFAALIGLAFMLSHSPGIKAFAALPESAPLPIPVVARFENFTEKDGLPAHKIHCVLKAGDGRLWLGTTNGLCVRQDNGTFRRFGIEDGLSHLTVLGIAEDPATGDLWIATMQGLSRLSGGKFTAFTQTNSGLPNNVVYGVAVAEGTVWAATAAGTGAYDIKNKAWKPYDQTNTVMNEPWCYAIAPGRGVIYLGIWAGGIVEHDPRLGTFKAYRDPDGEFHIALTADSGPIVDVTSGVAYDEGVLWQASYFGLARYDTQEATWRTWVQDKTPLVSNFINSVFAHGRIAWASTDQGVSVTDGDTWVNYQVGKDGKGVVHICRPGQPPETRTMATALSDGFVMAVWADDHEAWFATSNGLSHGLFSSPADQAALTSNPKVHP
jgi:ligand-binding sensor domain-containing protein